MAAATGKVGAGETEMCRASQLRAAVGMKSLAAIECDQRLIRGMMRPEDLRVAFGFAVKIRIDSASAAIRSEALMLRFDVCEDPANEVEFPSQSPD